jgi:L-threonylcarbamoyladenylate synthase
VSAELLHIDPDDLDPGAVDRAGAALRDGLLVAIPTETVYGLGANAWDEGAVRRVFAAKGRPADDPLIVHVHESWDLGRVLDGPISEVVEVLIDAFWPGPLTIIGPKAPEIAPSVTSGGPTVGVRAPAHPVARAVIAAADVPVAAPSANRFAYVSPTSAQHVLDDLGSDIDLVVDAGRTTHGIESTVVAPRGGELVVLRHGAVTVDDLLAAVGHLVEITEPASATAEPSASPGRAVRHYAPATPTVAVAPGVLAPDALTSLARPDGAAPSVAVLGYDDRPPTLPAGWRFVPLGSLADLPLVAFELYDVLRKIDAGASTDLLVIELTGAPGLGLGIDDRISRAAAGAIARDAAALAAEVAARC